MAVAQQMQASWEKKRKDREAKFLQAAKAEIDKCSSSRVDEFANAIAEMNNVYEKFVTDYTAVEDEIRKIWVEILGEQQALPTLAEKKHNTYIEHDKQRERGQVQGMAIAKKALEDYSRLISSLEPSESSN
ncbi:hypothetical protein CERSUDRAFT_96991 [Gelatoporia subvermispora B]|uniref:Uncharacterized protein n=1 Tax=Ceriporiopsis subvermispora (strain B) TaxID=914234 RepID=M2QDG2_CERS8|nr:hypothetical protein CERSUDRAFT_96991 [Gelatoporia subvermispora B]